MIFVTIFYPLFILFLIMTSNLSDLRYGSKNRLIQIEWESSKQANFTLLLHQAIELNTYSTRKMTSEKTIQYLQKINHRITCILNKNDVPLRAYSTGNIKDTFLYRKAMILKGILGNTFLNKFP